MKKLFSLFLILGVFLLMGSPPVSAQVSNAQTSLWYTQHDNDFGSYQLNFYFTADSLSQFVSNDFTIPPQYAGVNWVSTTPVTFVYKGVGASGVPKTDVFIQGVWANGDTTALDTVRLGKVNQTEGDTIGVLTFNLKRAPKYKIFVRNRTADVTSGYLGLYCPGFIQGYIPKGLR